MTPRATTLELEDLSCKLYPKAIGVLGLKLDRSECGPSSSLSPDPYALSAETSGSESAEISARLKGSRFVLINGRYGFSRLIADRENRFSGRAVADNWLL